MRADETAPFTDSVAINDGGGITFAVLLKTAGGAIVGSVSDSFVATDTGFYTGDAHTHTVLSDGQDTLKENFGTVYNKRQAFMIATDYGYRHGYV